ncbi:single-stranded-DNA-specific exonuclease RecJ [candidate division KSB1 bacterium]|nr:MAG: single-stranded-DNA-specific exonuclease RecJ [candidate division KSB1 bacterium]
MDFFWCFNETLSQKEVNELKHSLNVPEVIARILVTRGIKNFDEARKFFKPKFSDLYDPFLMKDLEKAVDRIIDAIKKGEKILVYGDYDVDGITSISILYLFLKKLNGNVLYYIPERLKEGYGYSYSCIRNRIKENISLIITVDCGITAVEEVKLTKKNNIDVIICDHHEPGRELPDAYAILDPKREDCNYPFKELAGVGVTFKLIQGLAKKLGLISHVVERYTDYVAIGSAADIVPLVDENRILVKLGLERLNKREKIGINALLKASGIFEKPVGTGQIVFILAPRLNAVGRLGSAERAVRLLTTNNRTQALNIATILEEENRNRKNIDEETFAQALEMIEADYDPEKDRAIVLSRENWHTGVIGIVASRIVERYYRPTILISVEDGVGKGSARSIPGFDLYLALRECEELLETYGGHKYAAGLTLKEENIDKFNERFKSVAFNRISEDILKPKIWIDGKINFREINERLINIINRFAPFGPQNMRPVFLTRNLEVVGTPEIVGSNHLKFKVKQNGIVIDAIGFNMGDLIYRIDPVAKNLDIVYCIEENTWEGQTTVQLRIKDLK